MGSCGARKMVVQGIDSSLVRGSDQEERTVPIARRRDGGLQSRECLRGARRNMVWSSYEEQKAAFLSGVRGHSCPSQRLWER